MGGAVCPKPASPDAVRPRWPISLAWMILWPIVGSLVEISHADDSVNWFGLIVYWIGPAIYAVFLLGPYTPPGVAALLGSLPARTAEYLLVIYGLVLWMSVWLLPRLVGMCRGRRMVRLIYVLQSVFALSTAIAGYHWLHYNPFFLPPIR